MSDTIRTIIIDDEELARSALIKLLAAYPEIEVIGECANGIEAVRHIQKLDPDLIFLDIQMPKIDGFDLLELLGDDSPFVVFVTAYDEYALKAFETNALDYLLKPVTPERIEKTLNKLHEQVKSSTKQKLKGLVQYHYESSSPLTRILIRNGSDVYVIPVQDVIYIEAQDDYVSICTKEQSYLKNEKISNLEIMLDPRLFCRIHRSYILNIDYLSKIEPYSKDNRIAVLINGRNLPISRAGYKRLLELL